MQCSVSRVRCGTPSLVWCDTKMRSCGCQSAAACPPASTALCAAGAGALRMLQPVARPAHATGLWHPWHPSQDACIGTEPIDSPDLPFRKAWEADV